MAAQQFLTRTEFTDQIIVADALDGLTNAQIDSVLLYASGQAGSYLRKRYALPLVSWGEELKLNTGKIAQYELFRRHGYRPGSGNDQTAKDAYDEAIEWFKQIATGLCELDCVDSTPTVEEQGPLSGSDATMSFRFNTGSQNASGCCDDE